jgi:hypothetical protein
MKPKFVICFPVLAFGLLASSASAGIVFDAIPTPTPFNVRSLGYEATATAEFGGMAVFGPGSRSLTSGTVLMSNWALESTYEPLGTSSGYNVPLVFNIYDVGPGNTVGSLLATSSVNAFIPWRPEASAGCDNGAWRAGDGTCYNGIAALVTFDFAGENVGNQVIYGLAFNTQNYGASPTGVSGPYNSLNFGLASSPPSVGTTLPDTAYWNTSYAPFYTDGGAGGVGVFRADTNWSPDVAAAQIITADQVPEPNTILLTLGAGLLVLWLRRSKRSI